MNRIISDFFLLGPLYLISRVFMGFRGLLIVSVLSPSQYGEYTIWLLFVFYCTMFDLGTLRALERDIPHYQGVNDAATVKKTLNVGWSSFFFLSTLASFILAIVSFIVFRQWLLSVLLALYLLTDKIYRAYCSLARLHVRYKRRGLAELLLALSSLALIWYLLPRYGMYAIFVGFIVSALISIAYLHRQSRIMFQWIWDIKQIFRYAKSAVPLAMIVYSIDTFHVVPLTVLAFLWDKTTLGYFAFAFRVFQICLSVFPFLIQEVVRTRMYYSVAQAKKRVFGLPQLFSTMGVYCLVTAMFWLIVYWWTDGMIHRFLPAYTDAIGTIKLLALALLPLGIAKICSDYLCSHTQKKTPFVVLYWLIGILIQGSLILMLQLNEKEILTIVPLIYLVGTLVVYTLVVGRAFIGRERMGRGVTQMICLLSPSCLAAAIVYIMKNQFGLLPSREIGHNFFPFFISMAVFGGVVVLCVGMMKPKKILDFLKYGYKPTHES